MSLRITKLSPLTLYLKSIKFAMKNSNVPLKQSCRQLVKIKPKTLKLLF